MEWLTCERVTLFSMSWRHERDSVNPAGLGGSQNTATASSHVKQDRNLEGLFMAVLLAGTLPGAPVDPTFSPAFPDSAIRQGLDPLLKKYKNSVKRSRGVLGLAFCASL